MIRPTGKPVTPPSVSTPAAQSKKTPDGDAAGMITIANKTRQTVEIRPAAGHSSQKYTDPNLAGAMRTIVLRGINTKLPPTRG